MKHADKNAVYSAHYNGLDAALKGELLDLLSVAIHCTKFRIKMRPYNRAKNGCLSTCPR